MPKVDPIMLWGFCFTVQAQQRFNQSWACAFHTSWYTDENHAMWDAVDDPNKRREIRYGNNIYVLFRALLHCKRFYSQDTLWQAIARGFNTSSTIVRVTAKILTDARRAQRDKPSKDISDTARAADDWIDFLDTKDLHSRAAPHDPEVHKVAEAFFKDQGKRLLNAARVPVNGRPSFNIARSPPRALTGEHHLSPGMPPSPFVKMESPRETADVYRPGPYGRKRSASPLRGDRSPKARRYDTDGYRPREPERNGALDELPTIRSTRSPRRLSHSQSGQEPRQAQPAQASFQLGAPPRREAAPAQTGQPPSRPSTARREEPPTPTRAAGPAVPVAGRDEARRVSDDRTALQARIAALEQELTTAQNKLATQNTLTTPAAQVNQDLSGLQTDMATVTNVISTMMESMHEIVDSLNSLQDEVSALTTQQKTLLPPAAPTPDLEAAIHQSLTTLLPTLLPTYLPPQPADLTSLESRLDKLTTLFTRSPARSTTPQQHQGQQGQQAQQQPQTLRQAMAFAERDLKHHLATVTHFYHASGSGGGMSRQVTEWTADFLGVLEEGVRVCQAGAAPGGAGVNGGTGNSLVGGGVNGVGGGSRV